MIAETIPGAYDAEGRKVFRPFDRRKGPHPTFPMGRFVSQPLTVKCATMEEVRQFLSGCKSVSDLQEFGKDDYWQPPEDFEKGKRGDCDDFALWTWRQLLLMGYDARFVAGRSGRYGAGHAWVEFFQNGACYIVEPQLNFLGAHMPRLRTLRYHPRLSVAWNGEKLTYYEHRKPNSRVPFIQIAGMLPEYVSIWAHFWLSAPVRIPRALWFLLKRFFKGFGWTGRTSRM